MPLDLHSKEQLLPLSVASRMVYELALRVIQDLAPDLNITVARNIADTALHIVARETTPLQQVDPSDPAIKSFARKLAPEPRD